MKKNSIKKRWFYDLTEKQVQKIIIVIEVIVFVILLTRLVTSWPTQQLLMQKGLTMPEAILFAIILLYCSMVAIGLLIWEFLWENPWKQFYLSSEKHDKEIVPKVREKFGLNSDFKEVLPKSEESIHYFAKETEDGILLSYRSRNGEELTSKIITNYDYFDLHYTPKL